MSTDSAGEVPWLSTDLSWESWSFCEYVALCSFMSRACDFLVGPKPIPFLRNLISCMLLIFPTGNVVFEAIESEIGSLICYYPADFPNVGIS